jgi:hypothetical protein
MKKTLQDNYNLKQFPASINFAFCPSKALIASSNLTTEIKEVESIINEYPVLNTGDILNSFRYFYICYSIKVENTDQENKDYFYFQLFSQIGNQQAATSPVYGFYTNDQIISMIKDIDAMFSPERHERQIFESYTEELYGSADQIINLMQEWTSLKLLQFNNLYFQDENAVMTLYKLIEESNAFEKLKEKKQKKPRTKSKSAKNTTSKKPTIKTKKQRIKKKEI